MTGLQLLEQATKIMIITHGEETTVSFKTLLKLIQVAKEQAGE